MSCAAQLALSELSNRFFRYQLMQHHAAQHDDCTDAACRTGAGTICKAVEHRRHLRDIQAGAAEPDGALGTKGNGLAVLDLTGHVLFIRGTLDLTVGQVSTQAATVKDEQYAAQPDRSTCRRASSDRRNSRSSMTFGIRSPFCERVHKKNNAFFGGLSMCFAGRDKKPLSLSAQRLRSRIGYVWMKFDYIRQMNKVWAG